MVYYIIHLLCGNSKSRDSSVSVVLGYGLDYRSSGAHPTSYPVCTGDSFPRGKAAGA
jgi:hypothetical protein